MFSLLLPLAIIALLVADSPKLQDQKEEHGSFQVFPQRAYNPKEEDKSISLVETSHMEQIYENTLQIRWVDWLVLNTLLQNYYIIFLRSFYIWEHFLLKQTKGKLAHNLGPQDIKYMEVLATQKILKENTDVMKSSMGFIMPASRRNSTIVMMQSCSTQQVIQWHCTETGQYRVIGKPHFRRSH